MILDDVSALRQLDRSSMLDSMENTPSRLKPPPDAERTFSNSFAQPRNIVIGGVGGSGIAGDIVTDYLKTESNTPVNVCRAYNLPSYVDEATLFIAISYSGETHETLKLLDQAMSRKAMIASISSGGTLLSISRAHEIPYLKVIAGLPPRVALPELLSAAVFVLEKASLLRDHNSVLDAASKSLAIQVHSIKHEVPTEDNKAKQMAMQLQDRVPLLLGPEERVSVLRRFKNELNENSKMPAFYMSMPEAFHDDIEGLESLSRLCSIQPVIFGPRATEAHLKTTESLLVLLRELGFPPVATFTGQGESVLSELLTAITFGDFVSVYLALLRGIDPTGLRLIPKFRAVAAG
jgi:glucose/mannose-6-phosphate isomerase